MYEYIKGKLVVKKVDYVALEINGIAYKIYTSLNTFDKLGEAEEKLYIYTNVKEDDISLYGFKTENERDLFKELVSISGVGPKLAIAILSTYESKQLIDIVIDENTTLLTKVPGLGPKKGKKLILDLKDKVKKLNIIEMYNEMGENTTGEKSEGTRVLLMKEDIKLVLESLGYSNVDIKKWISDEELSKFEKVEEAIKKILQNIQGKK